MDAAQKAALQAQFDADKRACDADPLAKAIGEVVLRNCGRMTVRSLVGSHGVLQIADAVAKHRALAR